MTTKELILALAELVHVFGDDEVLIDRPGDRGFRVTGVSDGGMLQVVDVIEDENGNIRDCEPMTETLARHVSQCPCVLCAPEPF